jgi:hypothetical protein
MVGHDVWCQRPGWWIWWGYGCDLKLIFLNFSNDFWIKWSKFSAYDSNIPGFWFVEFKLGLTSVQNIHEFYESVMQAYIFWPSLNII